MDELEKEVEKLDNELYKAKYHQKDYDLYNQLWDKIKGNKKILEVASNVVKNKFDEDTFFANAIVEEMLIDYDIVDKSLYQNLVNKIYSNTRLARTVFDDYSFLLYTLMNENLMLSEEQKVFAINEAMNKIGTTKHQKQMDDYENLLDNNGINDDETVLLPEIGPVGAKTAAMMGAYFFSSMGNEQAHGRDEYDICYHILKNPNFDDKMRTLVYDFYADDEYYDNVVELWEWDIVHLCVKEYEDEPRIYVDEILFISDEEVYKRLPIEQAKEVIKEINFIKRIREIRPMQYELEDTPLERKITVD